MTPRRLFNFPPLFAFDYIYSSQVGVYIIYSLLCRRPPEETATLKSERKKQRRKEVAPLPTSSLETTL